LAIQPKNLYTKTVRPDGGQIEEELVADNIRRWNAFEVQ
jgi:hypothetical protein